MSAAAPFKSSVLPPPPRSGHISPSQSGANAPTLVRVAEGKKIYSIRNSSFEVDEHYDVIKAIGLGAYGLVCSAIDLRYVPDHPLYQKALVESEKQAGCVIKSRDGDGKLFQYSPSDIAAATAAPGPRSVPTLRYHPFSRQQLRNGVASPYVAIKKIPRVFNDLIDGKRVLRETQILQYLRGQENVVRVLDIPAPRPSLTEETFRDLYIVSELLDTDLHLVLKSRQPLGEDHLRYIMYQMVRCLAWTHSSGVVHRDLKPGNLLLTGACELKVCDYGLARGGVPLASSGLAGKGGMQASTLAADPRELLAPDGEGNDLLETEGEGGARDANCMMELTDYVITRYYRPPELLIMSNYNHAVDLWSAGCIMAEIVLFRPLFQGRDYLSQLTMIAETPVLAGLPKTPEELDGFFNGGAEGTRYLKDIMFGRKSARASQQAPPASGNALENLRAAFFGREAGMKLSTEGLDFLHKLLTFAPAARLTAVEALRHPFFASLYTPHDEVTRDFATRTISPAAGATPVAADGFAGYYESEEEAPETMFEFDQRELAEPDLRALFWRQMERSRRRKERFNKVHGYPVAAAGAPPPPPPPPQ